MYLPFLHGVYHVLFRGSAGLLFCARVVFFFLDFSVGSSCVYIYGVGKLGDGRVSGRTRGDEFSGISVYTCALVNLIKSVAGFSYFLF